MEVDVSILVGGSLGAFHEVFLQRCARTLGIGVEFEQTLGELSVAEALLVEQGGDNLLGAAFSLESGDVLVIEACACLVEFGEESEIGDAVDELLYVKSEYAVAHAGRVDDT